MMESASSKILLRSGYSLEMSQAAERDTLDLRGPDGPICVRIHLGGEGPQVEIFSHSLRVHTERKLSLDCEELDINARRDIAIRAGGDMTQLAQGSMRLRAEGAVDAEGFAVNVRAAFGDVAVVANDDVKLDGERIRLNSPTLPK